MDDTPYALRPAMMQEMGWPSIHDLALLALFTFTANHLQFAGFGLYEDDLFFFGRTMWHFFHITTPFDWLPQAPQGRPLGFFVASVFSALFAHVPDLRVLYGFGFLILAGNVALLYRLGRTVAGRDETGRMAGLTLAALFAVMPMDTTRAYLVHAYFIQVAMLFLLSALLLYVHGHRVAAWTMGAVPLVVYEAVFFPFLAAPLLARRRFDHRFRREVAAHLAVCAGILSVYVLWRWWLGESRLVDAGQKGGSLPLAVMAAMAGYSMHGLRMLVHALVRAAHAPLVEWALALPAVGLVAGRLWSAARGISLPPGGSAGTSHGGGMAWQGPVNLALFGVAAVPLGYVTGFFFYPDMPWGGRITRIFSAATVGYAAVLAAGLTGALVLSAMAPRRIRGAAVGIVIAGAAAFLIALTVNGLRLQQDYVHAWDRQRAFLAAAVALIPDAEPGTLVVFEPAQGDAPDAGIAAHSWGYSTMLSEIFDWGTDPYDAPRLMMISDTAWREKLVLQDDGLLHWTRPSLHGRIPYIHDPVRPGRVIVLKGSADGLRRDDTPYSIQGVALMQPPAPPGARPLQERLPRLPFYDIVMPPIAR